MNTDPKKSAQPCGCDEGADHKCEQHRGGSFDGADAPYIAAHNARRATTVAATSRPQLFPESAQGRKDHPVFTGVLMYFPDAIAAVAAVSKAGNDQHNPGQPLHWAREKSTDQTDTATRHMMDHGVGFTKDMDGQYHLAKAAWRILAELQLTIEKDKREG